MSSNINRITVVSRVSTDIFFVIISWILSYYIRFYTFVPVPKGIPDFTLYVKLTPFIAVICFAIYTAFGLYKRSQQHRSALIEGIDIIQTSILATLAIVVFSYFYNEYRYSRLTLVVFAIIQPLLLIMGRSLIRKVMRYYRKKIPSKNILIVTSGSTIENALELAIGSYLEFTRFTVSKVLIVGDLAQSENAIKICESRNLKYTCEIPEDWVSFLSEENFESIIVSLAHKDSDFLDLHLEKIANQIMDIRILPDLVRYTKFATGVDLVKGMPVISIHDSPLIGMGSVYKRLLDIAGALFALLLFGPIMAVIAIIVPFTSRGPILYKQIRMGLDGKTFEILKFRSMPIDAESKTGAVWAKANENRATWFGSLLRKTSLDELPQFLNVLRGDMSLVGPRPERPVFVQQFRRDVPGYMLRHKVKAGITGWAQINGWRGNTSIEKRIECDLYYIQNWSIWLDIRILILTPFKGFISKNAY